MAHRYARTLAALAAMSLAACGGSQSEPVEPYDLPVVTSGGIDEDQYVPPPLTIEVESIDPEDDADLADAVEGAVAFGHYSSLNACEARAVGNVPFAVGTVVVGFTLAPDGTTHDVAVILTTGDPSPTFTACLETVVRDMVIDGLALEDPATLHLMLRYGE